MEIIKMHYDNTYRDFTYDDLTYNNFTFCISKYVQNFI
jgi:hypothetical protein